jgi:hypothetical protein
LWRKCQSNKVTLEMLINVLYMRSLGAEFGEFKTHTQLANKMTTEITELQREATDFAISRLNYTPGDDVDNSSLALYGSEAYSSKKCAHCHMDGHTKDMCYELIGFPDGGYTRRGKGGGRGRGGGNRSRGRGGGRGGGAWRNKQTKTTVDSAKSMGKKHVASALAAVESTAKDQAKSVSSTAKVIHALKQRKLELGLPAIRVVQGDAPSLALVARGPSQATQYKFDTGATSHFQDEGAPINGAVPLVGHSLLTADEDTTIPITQRGSTPSMDGVRLAVSTVPNLLMNLFSGFQSVKHEGFVTVLDAENSFLYHKPTNQVFELVDTPNGWDVCFHARERLRQLHANGQKPFQHGSNPFQRFLGITAKSHATLTTAKQTEGKGIESHMARALPAAMVKSVDAATASTRKVLSMAQLQTAMDVPVEMPSPENSFSLTQEATAELPLTQVESSNSTSGESSAVQVEGVQEQLLSVAPASTTLDSGGVRTIDHVGPSADAGQSLVSPPSAKTGPLPLAEEVTKRLADAGIHIENFFGTLIVGAHTDVPWKDACSLQSRDKFSSRDRKGKGSTKKRPKRQSKHNSKLAVLHHRRRAHQQAEQHRRTADLAEGVTGVEFYGVVEKVRCACCVEMLGAKAAFKDEADNRSASNGGRIHSDCKIINIRTKKGHRILVCFVDDNSRRTKVYLLKTLDGYLAVFKLFIEEECASVGVTVLVLRSDNGGNYLAGETKGYCASKGIKQEFSPPHCQSANGVAEAFFRVLFALVRTALHDQQRDGSFWGAAAMLCTDILNHTLRSMVPDVPEAIWQDKVVDFSHIRVPLCICYPFIEQINRGTSSSIKTRRAKCIYVGNAPNSKSYCCYDEGTCTVYTRRWEDVLFDERCRIPGAVEDDSKTEWEHTKAYMVASQEYLSQLSTEGTLDSPGLDGTPVQVSASANGERLLLTASSVPSTNGGGAGGDGSIPFPPAPSVVTPVSTPQVSAVDAQPASDSSPAGDERVMQLSRTMKLKDIAHLFSMKPQEYVKLCVHVAPDGKEGDWMRRLNRSSRIAGGSDMPIYPFPGFDLGMNDAKVKARSAGPGGGHDSRRGKAQKTGSAVCASTVGSSSVSATVLSPVHDCENERQEPLPAADSVADNVVNTDANGKRVSPRIAALQRQAALCVHAENLDFVGEACFARASKRGWSITPTAALAQYVDQVRANGADTKTMVALAAVASTGKDENGMIDGWKDITVEPKGYSQAHKDPKASVHWRNAEEHEWNGLWKRQCFQDCHYQARFKLHVLLCGCTRSRNRSSRPGARSTESSKTRRRTRLHALRR